MNHLTPFCLVAFSINQSIQISCQKFVSELTNLILTKRYQPRNFFKRDLSLGSWDYFYWIQAREKISFHFLAGRTFVRSFVVEMWTEITLIEKWDGAAVRYRANIFFTAAISLPPFLSLFPPQSDFSLVDFYLNLICKKSLRVAIVIVVSLPPSNSAVPLCC